MNDIAQPDAYGVLTEPSTLTIQRHLPGPIERVWAYLTESELRRQWLAAGPMELVVGGAYEFTWRNDELTTPPGQRPDGFAAEHSMEGRITALDPPRHLAITWGSTGGVTFDLAPAGGRVLLTITHHRVTDPTILLRVSAGWHAHLDVLAARASGEEPAPFWDHWLRLQDDYARRLQS
jgi:uncharacterized protein YndB with AHSA1/START domain